MMVLKQQQFHSSDDLSRFEDALRDAEKAIRIRRIVAVEESLEQNRKTWWDKLPQYRVEAIQIISDRNGDPDDLEHDDE